MKRFPILGALLLIPAIAIFGIVGCTKTEPVKKDNAVKPAADGTEKPKEGAKAEEITTPTTGIVKGVVTFDGDPPPAKTLAAIKEHKEGADCMKGGRIDTEEQTWIIGKDKGVANVVISLSPPKGKEFKVTDELKAEFKKPAVVDQPYCAYRPHVVALLADVQPLVFENHFAHSHNVKIDRGAKMGPYDQIILKGDKKELPPFTGPEKDYTAVCSMHTFMNAKICVFKNPYFAVTKEDGSFEIKNVPIDTELTVYMWHESMGNLSSKVEQKKITLKKGEDGVVNLKIAAK